MRPQLDALLRRRHGAAARADLLSVVSRHQLDDEVRRGHLVAIYPRAYCRPWDVDDLEVRRRAALASVESPVALSHVTALTHWELPAPAALSCHVTVPVGRHPIGRTPTLVVHRTRVPTRVRTVGGLPTVDLPAALVRSWPLLSGADARAPVIEAIRRRLTSTASVRRYLERAVGLAGRSRLAGLLTRLDAGCESELELYGQLEVFDAPGLRHGVGQYQVEVGGRRYRLDLGYEAERVAVEMDGLAYHSAPADRERDRQRDTALAAAGWVTLRFSYARLHDDPDGCRRETLATLAARSRRRRGA